MFREEMVVFAPPSVSSFETVLRAREVLIVVLRARCSCRQMLEVLLARGGIVVQRQLEFGTLEAIFGWVSAGLGISWLPRALIGGVCEAGRVSVHELTRADTSSIRCLSADVRASLRARDARFLLVPPPAGSPRRKPLSITVRNIRCTTCKWITAILSSAFRV